MAIKTRLTLIGIQGRPYGTFNAKTPAEAGGAHPFTGGVTRLTLFGIMGRPYLGFVAKGERDVVSGFQIARRRRRVRLHRRPPVRVRTQRNKRA